MSGFHKFSLKTLPIAIGTFALFCIVTWTAKANGIGHHKIDSILTSDTVPNKKRKALERIRGIPQQNNIPTAQPSVPLINAQTNTDNSADTTKLPADSLQARTDTFSLKMSKDTLDGPVNYEAEDSVVVLVPEKKIIMYGKTKTLYQDITLTAPKVAIDQKTNILTAYHETDSTGYEVTRARFEQGENQFESNEIQFNFKTQKGLTKNTFTKQDDFFVQGETIKKISSNTLFIRKGRFTTCNLDEPHFDFFANRMKVINGKVAVTGFVQLEFEGVPIPKPIGLPFGLFPLARGRRSGLLAPQFTVNEQFGLGLEGLGYYKALNDYFDATIRGNIYSYGGWSINFTPTYRKLYRYNGAFNLNLLNSKISFKGDPDYSKSKTFMISWNHSQDQKARPGTNFSGNVNAGSTRHNRLVPNNPQQNFQNQLNSSIAYSKSWAGRPYNLTLSANHNQNSVTRLVNLSLPDATFTVTSINPFQRKERIGSEKWYEKIGVGYSGSFRNQISFYDDSSLRFHKLIDTLQLGAMHQLPLTLSLPPLGPFVVSPSISYQEQWIMRNINLDWNESKKKVDSTFTKGFYTARQISTGLSFNTSVYGTYQFRKSRVIALRHVMRPTFGFSYTPNMAKNYWETVQIDTAGRTYTYSKYSANLITQGFGNRRFGGINFGLDNTLEMKMRSKKDTGASAIKKIRLIDGLSFSSGYNFLEDSFQLNNFALNLRSTLFDKINLSATANLDPYQIDRFGRRINRFAWKDEFNLGRITSAGMSLSTQFKSKPRDGAEKTDVRPTANSQIGNDPTLLADQQRLQEYMRRNPSEFVDFNIPWDIGLDVSVSLTRQLKPDFSGFETVISATSSFRSSFSLTPKWNFSTNGYLDLKTKELQTFTMSINREMHCWQMSINVTPVGYTRYFNISISPKSSLLQDLKVNRTRSFTEF